MTQELTTKNLMEHERLTCRPTPTLKQRNISSIAGFDLSTTVVAQASLMSRPPSSVARKTDRATTVATTRAGSLLCNLEHQLREEQEQTAKMTDKLDRLTRMVESLK